MTAALEFDPADSDAFAAFVGHLILDRIEDGGPMPGGSTLELIRDAFRAGFTYGESE